jgi:predicted enzyme related to lactoylglutathione lyase
MDINHNIIGWIEIPVIDMERAIAFYEAVFDFKLHRANLANLDMAMFPWVENSEGSGGSLVYNPEYYRPSADGTLVYFTAFSGDLANELSRVESSGGRVIMPKTQISEEHGYMALFVDTEGNRIGLHNSP